ncbi:MAG: hypothetical protein R3E87_17715 [Burkholderiaceae bacterium]
MNSSSKAEGILAIWNDRRAEEAGFFERWYQGEHLPERLGVDGFFRGRRYESLGEGPQFFTYYEVASPAVLTSPEYLARLDDPTPDTTRIMTSVFTNMNRTVCRRTRVIGRHRGGHAVTARFVDERPVAALEGWLEALAQRPAVARAECWVADAAPSRAPTAEEKLRGAGTDRSIGACVFVDVLREADARALAGEIATQCRALGESLGPTPEIGVYRFMSELESD